MLPSLISAVRHSSDKSVSPHPDLLLLPKVDAAVLVVVDGLGRANLSAMRAHARFLSSHAEKTIETVVPTTTGAALTSLMTGTEPGEHGLLGYRIRDENDGSLRSTLSDWHGLSDPWRWQRARPLLVDASALGMNPIAIGRRAHEGSGLTRSILHGAEYASGETIAERFAAASRSLAAGSRMVYLYVDELDRAAHSFGWLSDVWLHALEELDAQLRSFAAGLPETVGCLVTADHGVIDVPVHQHVLMDAVPQLLDGVALIGGEPRMRYLYLGASSDLASDELAAVWRAEEGHRAAVWSRSEAISSGVFGGVAPEVRSRIGDVIIAADGPVAYYTSRAEDAASRRMIGQHGGISREETEVPLIGLAAFSHPWTR